MEPVATSSTELPGFEKVDLSNMSEETLSTEDLESSKKQLWLIKVPYEFDISKLNGSMMILNGTQELPIKKIDKDSGKRYETRSSKYKDSQSCPYNVVVPSRKGNDLQVAKNFTGYLDVLQTIKVPMLVYPPTPPVMYTDVPKNLQARWKPFGHREPPLANLKARSDEKGDEKGGKRKQKIKERRSKESSRKERKEESPKKKKKKMDGEEQIRVKTEDKPRKKKNNT